jgi:UDP-GlcNAc:undecaprenyl-phosphate/decaprenyl-phosphate GlcNAc-1-phosphate transferase
MPPLADYGIVLGVVVVTTLVLVPLVRRLAIRIGAVVRPDERRVHKRPTPTLGGVGMLVGFLAGMAVAWRLPAFSGVFDNNTEPLGLVLAAITILVVGVIDDLREVSAPAKMSGIVVAASVLVFSGISILTLRIPFVSTFILDSNWSYLLSVIWVIGMANAINFIDGLDGLAAGIVGIAAVTFFLYAQQLVHEGSLPVTNIGPLIAVLVLGVCVGFLPYNIHPARIFMGDGGALLLGLLMAASTMVVGGRTDTPVSGQTFFFFAPVFIPLVILGVPILDTAFAIVRRARTRTSPAAADKDHLHHRLMRLGHGQRRSVFILWGWTALLCGFVLYPTYTHKGDAVVPFGIAALGLALYTLLHPGLREARRADHEAAVRAVAERADEVAASMEEPVHGDESGEATPTATAEVDLGADAPPDADAEAGVAPDSDGGRPAELSASPRRADGTP